MSLSASKLATGLLALTSTFPASYVEAGQRWAAAYAAYATGATTAYGVVAPPPTAALASALASTFASGGATAPAIAAALTAYWLSPPAAFAGSRAGIVTSVTGTAALAAALAAVFALNVSSRASASDACNAIAAKIDVFTKTVIVTSPAPAPPIVGPIS